MSKARRTGKSLAEALVQSIAQESQSDQTVAPAKAQAVAAQPEGVPLSILVTAADRKRLRQLSLDADLSIQKLGHEAWNLLLRQRGLPELEPLTANRPSGRKRE